MTTLVWKEADIIVDWMPASLYQLDEVLPAITVSILGLVVGSLLTSPERPPSP